MAIYQSIISDLVAQVAALLRHDNLDPEVTSWLHLAYADFNQKAPMWPWFHEATITTVLNQAQYSVTVQSTIFGFRNTVASTIRDTSANVYLLKRLNPTEFSQRFYGIGSPVGGRPAYYTIAKTAQSGTTTTFTFELYPPPSSSYVGTNYFRLFYWRNEADEEQASGAVSFDKLPPHAEHVLMWGAATIGAKAIRPELYALYKQEYDQAMQQWYDMMNFEPDKTPIMIQHPMGPYLGTRLGAPKFPPTIS